jgi:hypothetical protein
MKQLRAACWLLLLPALLATPAAADEVFWRLLRGPSPWQAEAIPFHPVQLDREGKLLPWTSYDRVIRLAMGFIERVPRDARTGLPWYEQYCCFRHETMQPKDWPHNPAGLYGMMVETLIRYHAYTGERRWIEIVRQPLDHLIAESTPADYAWPRVPYASADNSGRYRGGSYEGIDGIEPDKIGQAAVGYLRFHQLTGERRYLEAALHCAEVLAAKIRPGDERHSPWPFRVNARSGEVIEEYTSDVLWPIALFDELAALGLRSAAQARARDAAWTWLLRYPLQNMRWKGYFEDVFLDPHDCNRDQYTPGELARYLMLHPELDPDWREHVSRLLGWIKETLGDARSKWHGATAIREQRFWMQVASSHTARYASLLAMWSARGGGAAAREEALRCFALATYLAREDGIVIFSIEDRDVWFSDGYFDYVPHFLDGMAALPEMAPPDQDHLLSSSSVILAIDYGRERIRYRASGDHGSELLRLSFTPLRVTAIRGSGEADAADPHWSHDPATGVLRIERRGRGEIAIEGGAAATGLSWSGQPNQGGIDVQASGSLVRTGSRPRAGGGRSGLRGGPAEGRRCRAEPRGAESDGGGPREDGHLPQEQPAAGGVPGGDVQELPEHDG